jgi:hypothetical protein
MQNKISLPPFATQVSEEEQAVAAERLKIYEQEVLRVEAARLTEVCVPQFWQSGQQQAAMFLAAGCCHGPSEQHA